MPRDPDDDYIRRPRPGEGPAVTGAGLGRFILPGVRASIGLKIRPVSSGIGRQLYFQQQGAISRARAKSESARGRAVPIPESRISFMDAYRAFIRATSVVSPGRTARRRLVSADEALAQMQVNEIRRRNREEATLRGRLVRQNMESEWTRRTREANQKAATARTPAKGNLSRLLPRSGARAGALAHPGIGWLYEQAGKWGSIHGERERWLRWLGNPNKPSIADPGQRAVHARPERATAVPARSGAGSTRAPATPGLESKSFLKKSAPSPASPGRASPTPSPLAIPGMAGMVQPSPKPQPSRARASAPAPAPARAPQVRTQNFAEQLLQRALSGRARPRVQAQSFSQITTRTASPVGAPAPSSATQPLTLLQSQVLTSSATKTETKQDECECKPAKKKPREFACSNPLVSRYTTKDGTIHIKRKLLCPPFKRK